MRNRIRRLLLASLAVFAPIAGVSAIVAPTAAHASTVRMSDVTWGANGCTMSPGCDVETYLRSGDGQYALSANGSDGTSASTYALTYHTTYYCLQDTGTGKYVAAYSSDGGDLLAEAGACGVNEEWGITCVGSGHLYLEVKGGPLTGDYASHISSSDADLRAAGSGADEFAITGECGL